MKNLIIVLAMLLVSCTNENICQDCGEFGCFYNDVNLRMKEANGGDLDLYDAVWQEADERGLEDSDVEMLMLEYHL